MMPLVSHKHRASMDLISFNGREVKVMAKVKTVV
jgi:hypothetical protein